MQLSKVTKPKSKTIKAVWKKAGGKVSGYNVQIALNKTFTKGKKNYYIKKGDAVSKTITKLKKKTYYVRVRAYKKVGTKNYFGAYSNVKKVTVKK